MVEEQKQFSDSVVAGEEQISTGRKVAGFLLTLLLIPFLFAGACLGLLVTYGKSAELLIFCGLGISILLVYVAVLTKNPGIKWGLIVVGVVVVAAIAVILFMIFGR